MSETGKYRTEQLINDLIGQIGDVKRSVESFKHYQDKATVSITEIRTHMEYSRASVAKLEKTVAILKDGLARIEERMVDDVRGKLSRHEERLKRVDHVEKMFERFSADFMSDLKGLLAAGEDLDKRLTAYEKAEKAAEEKSEKISASVIAWLGLLSGIASAIAAAVALFQ